MLMRKLIWIGVILTFLSIIPADAQIIDLNKAKGIYQDQEDKQIKFSKIERLKIDYVKTPIKKIAQIRFIGDKVFILESNYCEIYVYNYKDGSYLYSIGRPGQGPGDLEFAVDFFIKDDRVYVLNTRVNRIEVFDLKGKYQDRIRLKIPDSSLFINTDNILTDERNNFYISYKLSTNKVDMYDSKGNYLKTILKRTAPIRIPGKNISNCSQIGFTNNKQILHFDRFRGIFTKLTGSMEIEKKFGAHNSEIKESILEVEKEYKNPPPKKYVSSNTYYLWTNFCVDDLNHIYTIPDMLKQQILVVFSSNGDFLYWKPLKYFDDNKISIYKTFCNKKDIFVFVSRDVSIYIVYRRIK